MRNFTYNVSIIDHAPAPICAPNRPSVAKNSRDNRGDQIVNDVQSSKRVIINEDGRAVASLRLNYISDGGSLKFERGTICNKYIDYFVEIVELEYGRYSIGSELYIMFFAVYKEMVKEGIEHIRLLVSPETARHLKLVGLYLEEVTAPKSASDPFKSYWVRADKPAFHIFYRQVPSRDAAILRMIEANPNRRYGNPRNILRTTVEEFG